MIKIFKPTHKIIDGEKEILVQEIIGDDEFMTRKDFDDFYPNPCMLGTYALHEFDKNLVMIQTSYQDKEFGECVSWQSKPHLKLVRICPKCYHDKIIKNGKTTSGKQRYKCSSCGNVFSAYPSGRPPIGDRAMTNAEHQAKFRAKKKQINKLSEI